MLQKVRLVLANKGTYFFFIIELERRIVFDSKRGT